LRVRVKARDSGTNQLTARSTSRAWAGARTSRDDGSVEHCWRKPIPTKGTRMDVGMMLLFAKEVLPELKPWGPVAQDKAAQ